jgi:integrase
MEGLSLYVAVNGTKSWHFRFYWLGKQQRYVLGKYPLISLKAARSLRDEARDKVALGVDPRVSTQAEPDVLTFEALANQWHEFKTPRLTTGRKGSAVQSRSYLDKDLIPVLGAIAVTAVTRQDILKAVRKIESRGAFNVAEKCRTWLHQIFRYAIAEGLVAVNPATDLDIVAAVAPPVKHNPYLQQAELPEFLVKLRGAGCLFLTEAGIRLLLLTGVRTQELRFASPDQFDLENALWSIPPDVVKQLRSSVRTKDGTMPPYLVPLSTQAVELVRRVLPLSRGKYLLPGRNDPTRPMSENTINTAIKRLGYEDRLTGHGIRATLSTALNEQGYEPRWVEAQLSHTDPNAVKGTYDHAKYVEQRRTMMQAWADQLDQLEATGLLHVGP